MKKLAIIAVLLVSMTMSRAASIHYFTASQANRTVSYLNMQNELMIYCGYEYEIETYVLVNEVWKERVNSAFYEIWIFGYDAYTGEEVYMPIDLDCVWLFNANKSSLYSAAQYLRFHAPVHVPTINWYIPPYNPYKRVFHVQGHVHTYHFDVHRRGWMPPAPPAPGVKPPVAVHPYYMRTPQTPPPAIEARWTPGTDRPTIARNSQRLEATSTTAPASRTVATPSSGATRQAATTTTTRQQTSQNSGATRQVSTTTKPERSASTTSATRSTGTTSTSSSATRTSSTTSATRSAGTTSTSSSATRTSSTTSATRSAGTTSTSSSATRTSSTTATRSASSTGSTTKSTSATRQSGTSSSSSATRTATTRK